MSEVLVEIERTMNELIQLQMEKLYKESLRINPALTKEDLLQPNDYPELENHPSFRYEEGVLHGYLSMQMALQLNVKGKF